MNPFTFAINGSGLRGKQNATSDLETGALAALMLAEQLDSDTFSGLDFYTETERRLRDVYGLPPYFVQQIAAQFFASPKSRLQRGL